MSKAQSLQELLAGGSELTIVCHNNPDPDCLASALALGRIAAATGIDERHILTQVDLQTVTLRRMTTIQLGSHHPYHRYPRTDR